jgi:hypothetical protein
MKRHALVLVALRTDDEHIQRRLNAVLGVAATYDQPPNTEPHVYAKPVDDLVPADLDGLAAFIGWDGVRRLNLGADVANGYLNTAVQT